MIKTLNVNIAESRNTEHENTLLSSIAKNLFGVDEVSFFPDNKILYGLNSIIAYKKNTIYKLFAGRKDSKTFQTFTESKTEKIITDYKLYTEQLQISGFRLAKPIELYAIKVNNNKGFFLLEIQEKIKGSNLFYLLQKQDNSVIFNEIIKCYKNVIEILPKIGKTIGIDTNPGNFIQGGYFIDYFPSHIIDGSEHQRIKKLSKTNEYYKFKLISFYSHLGVILSFLLFFSKALKHKDQLEMFISLLNDMEQIQKDYILKHVNIATFSGIYSYVETFLQKMNNNYNPDNEYKKYYKNLIDTIKK